MGINEKNSELLFKVQKKFFLNMKIGLSALSGVWSIFCLLSENYLLALVGIISTGLYLTSYKLYKSNKEVLAIHISLTTTIVSVWVAAYVTPSMPSLNYFNILVALAPFMYFATKFRWHKFGYFLGGILAFVSIHLLPKLNIEQPNNAKILDEFNYVTFAILMGILMWNIMKLERQRIELLTSEIKANFKLSERVLYLKQEESLRKVAEAEAEFKSLFLANMSHEIRTPLNGIIGMIDLLEVQTELNPHQQTYVDTVKKSSRRLVNIINDVLDISKIQAGKMKIFSEPVNVFLLIENAINLFEGSAREKNVKLKIGYDASLPKQLLMDDTRVNQVLNNFISNAIKFSDGKDVELKVSNLGINDTNCRIRFEVVDQGIGISEDNLAELFADFAQVNSSETRKIKGTGLGLAISKKLVELMGGEVGATSKIGEGSTFWFELNPEIASEAVMPKVTLPQAVKIENERFGLNVLLVEDQLVNQTVAKLMLKQLGCSCELARNGIEAIEMYREHEHEFDFILMDIQMPEMDGLTCTIELLKQFENVPPIFGLSANVMPDDIQMYMENGMSGYINKPLTLERLEKELRKISEQKGDTGEMVA